MRWPLGMQTLGLGRLGLQTLGLGRLGLQTLGKEQLGHPRLLRIQPLAQARVRTLQQARVRTLRHAPELTLVHAPPRTLAQAILAQTLTRTLSISMLAQKLGCMPWLLLALILSRPQAM
jgi:hypothetical protein